jgi:ribosomal protein S21
MPTEIKKRESESINSFLYRFNKKIQQSGMFKEAKKRRFRNRPVNRGQRRLSAVYRARKDKEIKTLKKYAQYQ